MRDSHTCTCKFVDPLEVIKRNFVISIVSFVDDRSRFENELVVKDSAFFVLVLVPAAFFEKFFVSFTRNIKLLNGKRFEYLSILV